MKFMITEKTGDSPLLSFTERKQVKVHRFAAVRGSADNGVEVGTVTVRIIGHLAEIEKLVVHPACRRQGIARSLLQHVERFARAQRCKKLCALVRGDNLASFLLFVEEEFAKEAKLENHYEEGVPMLVMSKFV
ncbi:MAG: GNAT family N-acetyltransferase [Methanosarcinales archaeon]